MHAGLCVTSFSMHAGLCVTSCVTSRFMRNVLKMRPYARERGLTLTEISIRHGSAIHGWSERADAEGDQQSSWHDRMWRILGVASSWHQWRRIWRRKFTREKDQLKNTIHYKRTREKQFIPRGLEGSDFFCHNDEALQEGISRKGMRSWIWQIWFILTRRRRIWGGDCTQGKE